MFLCIRKLDLHNFADDNTITTTCNTLIELLKTLKQELESAVSWFKQSEMIVNADRFKAMILNKKESEAKYKLAIDNNNIGSFDQHISNLCSKALIQLNALGGLPENIGIPENIAIVNSFIYANVNYCPLVWSKNVA